MSWFVLLLFLLAAALVSRNFFFFPPSSSSEVTSLTRPYVIGSIVLFLVAGLVPFFPWPDTISSVTIHGIFLFTAFSTYLLILPLSVTRTVLLSGNASTGSLWHAMISGVRMWIIVMPVTQIVGIALKYILLMFLPSDQLPEQSVTEEIETSVFLAKDMGVILSVGFFIPFVEEIFFRGFLQTFLKGKLGQGKAIIYTSVIFALVHVEPSLGSLIFVPVLYILSLCAGFIFEKERSILAPAVMHSCFNLIPLIVMGYSRG